MWLYSWSERSKPICGVIRREQVESNKKKLPRERGAAKQVNNKVVQGRKCNNQPEEKDGLQTGRKVSNPIFYVSISATEISFFSTRNKNYDISKQEAGVVSFSAKTVKLAPLRESVTNNALCTVNEKII